MLIIKISDNKFELYYSQITSYSEISEVVIQNQTYKMDNTSKEDLGFLGFFDWLRYKELIVGIRIYFFDHLPYLSWLSSINCSQIQIKDKVAEFLFSALRYDPILATDQDFGENYVYLSQNKSFLLTFRTDFLAESELYSLLKSCKVLSTAER